MLKIPNVGNALASFKYLTSINSNNQLEICIIYQVTNRHGVLVHKMQNYLVWPDSRWPNIQTIKTTIDNHFVNATINRRVAIRYDAARMYLHFNSDQFSGQSVL